MTWTDLEVEAGFVCTCSCPADHRASCHMGGSALSQVAYWAHNWHCSVCGSHSPREKKEGNVLLFNTDCSNLCPEIRYIKERLSVKSDLCLGGWSFLLLAWFLLVWVRGNGGHTFLWLHCLNHLLLWLLGDGCQGLLFFRGQGERLQVITTWFGLQVGVIEQKTLLLFEFGDLAVHAHCSEPAPGERGGVFETLKHIPGRNLLFRWYLKALMAERQSSVI